MKNNNIVVIHVAKYLDGNDRLCNHNCLFCMERMNPDCSNEILPSTIEVENALKKYLSFNDGISCIYVAGGEPTLRLDFDEIIKIANKYCDSIILSTCCDFQNSEFMINKINELGIKRVATSIHSCSPRLHDWLTGSVDSFKRTILNIKKLLELGISVTINSVINRFNIGEIEEIVRSFDKLHIGISKLTLTHYIHHGNAYYHNELKFNIDQYRDNIDKAIKAVGEVNYPVTFRDFPFCIDNRLAFLKENVENVEIIGFDSSSTTISEKAPSYIKDKCFQCVWYNECPKYLKANYGEEL